MYVKNFSLVPMVGSKKIMKIISDEQNYNDIDKYYCFCQHAVGFRPSNVLESFKMLILYT